MIEAASPQFKLKEIREAAGLSQHELAKLVGVSQPFLCDLERNRRGATNETLERIAGALNVEVTDLYGPDNDS